MEKLKAFEAKIDKMTNKWDRAFILDSKYNI